MWKAWQNSCDLNRPWNISTQIKLPSESFTVFLRNKDLENHSSRHENPHSEVYCAWAFYKQLAAHGVGESNLFSFILEIEHSGGQVSLHLKHEAVQLLSVRFWLDMFSVYYKEIQYLRAKADLLVEELKILSRVQSLNYGVTSQVVRILMCM